MKCKKFNTLFPFYIIFFVLLSFIIPLKTHARDNYFGVNNSHGESILITGDYRSLKVEKIDALQVDKILQSFKGRKESIAVDDMKEELLAQIPKPILLKEAKVRLEYILSMTFPFDEGGKRSPIYSINSMRKIVSNNPKVITAKYTDEIIAKKISPPPILMITNRGENIATKKVDRNIKIDVRPRTTTSKQNSDGSRTQTTLKISILPVRFVYVNDENEIVKIWNNTKEEDTKYILKYIDFETNKEIEENEILANKYLAVIKNIDVFAEGVIYDINVRITTENSVDWDIQVNDTGSGLEEVHTYI